MYSSGLLLINGTSLIGANATSNFSRLNVGMQGALSIRADVLGTEVQLITKGIGGSSVIVVNTSKAVTNFSFIAPLYMPAGEYAIRNVGSSSINVFAGIYPTP